MANRYRIVSPYFHAPSGYSGEDPQLWKDRTDLARIIDQEYPGVESLVLSLAQTGQALTHDFQRANYVQAALNQEGFATRVDDTIHPANSVPYPLGKQL